MDESLRTCARACDRRGGACLPRSTVEGGLIRKEDSSARELCEACEMRSPTGLELKARVPTGFDLQGGHALGDTRAEFSKIRCPACAWQPRLLDRWWCSDVAAPEFFFGGCGYVWNTFTTRGRCPGCKYQWKHTTCLRCQEMSLHEAWYANAPRRV